MTSLNEKTKRLLEIKSLISSLESEKEVIEKEFKQMGTFETDDYFVAINNQSRKSLAGLNEVTKIINEEILIQHNLIKNTEFKVIKINKKNQNEAA